MQGAIAVAFVGVALMSISRYGDGSMGNGGGY